MELLQGSALDARAEAQGGRLPTREVMLLADQLLDVLTVAHEAGIVHRDIKPENLFLTKGGVLKILDFGVAQLCQGAPRSSTHTLAGRPLGTPAYMAPEQARGRWDMVDARSDLWSVGATVFALVSGRLVHEEGTVEETLAATFSRPARSLATVAPESPPALVAWVDRALALEKAERWQSAREMRAALREAYAAAFGEAMPDAPSAESSGQMRALLPSLEGREPSSPRLAAPTPPPLTADTRSAPAKRAFFGAAAVFVGLVAGTLVYLTVRGGAQHVSGAGSAAAGSAAAAATATSAAAATARATATAVSTTTPTTNLEIFDPAIANGTAAATATATAKPIRPAPRPKPPQPSKSVDPTRRTW
jgi:serine/threonine-protein kinase